MKNQRLVYFLKCSFMSILIGFSSLNSLAEGLEGSWKAKLIVTDTVKLPLNIHLIKKAGKWRGTLDTPTQGGFGIPMSAIDIKGKKLIFEIANMQIHYEGLLNTETNIIAGTFIQGRPFKLDFSRANEKPIERIYSNDKTLVIGTWNGNLETSTGSLAFILEVEYINNKFNVRAQSPDQSPQYFPVDTFSFDDGNISFTIKNLKIEFSGSLSKDKKLISGKFKQGQAVMSLKLDKKPLKKELSSRPQTPKEPFDYNIENIEIPNYDANIILAGTLTKPFGLVKATAIMITGSGPQDRDETLFRHKPFAVIADDLTKRGYAVLRLDDRGIGLSTGVFLNATSLDFASDINSAIDYLKSRTDIPQNKIGLIGHSEGGMIAPMVASKRNDLAFVILMAAPGVKIIDLYVEQRYQIFKSNGVKPTDLDKIRQLDYVIFNKINSLPESMSITKETQQMIAQISRVLGLFDETLINLQVNNLVNTYETPWFRYFLKFDPQPYLTKTLVPILTLNGALDVQVVASQNLAGIKKTLTSAKHSDFTIVELERLNHLFQTAETGAITEYNKIEETFAPAALKLISGWLDERFSH